MADYYPLIARAVDGTVPGGRIYELGGPEVATLERLVRYMLEVTMRKRLVVDLPLPVDDPRRRKPDITLARVLLGFEPKVDLAEGMARTRRW